MSDTGSGGENVAASEPTTEQGEAVSEQSTQSETTGTTTSEATEGEASPVSRLRITGHDLYDTFTWRADDDSDPVVITREGTEVPPEEAGNIVASAARGGISLEAC